MGIFSTDKNWKQIVKSSKHSYKDFSKHIADYLDVEWDEDYYQHIMQVLYKEVGFRDSEEEAFKFWQDTLSNPFENSVITFRAMQHESSIEMLLRYAKSGTFNNANAQAKLKQIKRDLTWKP